MTSDSLLLDSLELVDQSTGTPYLAGFNGNTDDFGAPVPDTAVVAGALLDGDRVSGSRSGNRTVQLTVLVQAQSRLALTTAVNALFSVLERQQFTVTWTPAGGLPVVFDCFRGSWSRAYDPVEGGLFTTSVTLSFPARPFARSSVAQSGSVLASGGAIQTQVDGMNSGSFTNATLDTSIKYEGAGSARIVLSRNGTGPYRYDTQPIAPGRSIAATDLSAYASMSARFRWPAPADFTLVAAVTATLLLGSAAGSSYVRAPRFGVTTSSTAWNLMSFDLTKMTVATGSGVDLTAVTSWAIGVDAGAASPPFDGLPATSNAWFEDLRAYPAASVSNTTGEGSVAILPDVKGTARTPVALTATRTASGGSVGTPALRTAQVTQTTEAALTTASFTPTANELLVAVVALGTSASVGATTLAISDTLGGLTWTQVTANKGAVGNETIASIFYATAPASPTAGTVTVTPSRTGVADGATLNMYGISGASGVGATGTSATGGLSVTLSAAPASTSMVLGLYSTILGSDPVTTVPAGHTGLFTDQHVGSVTYVTASYDNGSASQTLTWGGTNTGNSAIVAIEITKAAATAGTFTNMLLHAPPGNQDPDATILAGLSSGSVTIPAANMNYDDTFTVVGLLSTSASTTRTVTVTITQKVGATTLGTVTLTASITGTQTIVTLGQVVLPLYASPAENTNGSLIITVASTGDTWSDVALCSTAGQTVLALGLASATAAMYVDLPDSLTETGQVYATATDRTAAYYANAVSGSTVIPSGGAFLLDPAYTNRLLAASTSGAPDITYTYFPAWLDERDV